MINYISHEEAYNQIQDGDIMFVANATNFVARLIRWATKSTYSHCAFLFWVEVAGMKRILVVEQQGGTRRRLLNSEYYDDQELHIISNPQPWKDQAPKALERIGVVPYSYFEAAYTGVRDFLFRSVGIQLPAFDFPGEICSEFVARVLGLEFKDLSPQDLFDQLHAPVRLYVKANKKA